MSDEVKEVGLLGIPEAITERTWSEWMGLPRTMNGLPVLKSPFLPTNSIYMMQPRKSGETEAEWGARCGVIFNVDQDSIDRAFESTMKRSVTEMRPYKPEDK